MELLASLFQLLKKGDVISIQEMIQDLNVSERKVRAVIGELRRLGRRNGFEIKTVGKQAFKLNVITDQKYLHFSQTQEELLKHDTNRTMRVHNTVMYLMNIKNRYASYQDIAVFLDIDVTLLKADAEVFDAFLKQYGLKRDEKPGVGMRIEGREVNKRRILSELFAHNIKKYSGMRYFTKKEHEAIQKIIYIALYDNHLHFNEPIFLELLAQVEVFVMRIFNTSKKVRADVHGIQIDDASANAAAYIVMRLKEEFGLPVVPKEEQLLALNIFLMTNSSIVPEDLLSEHKKDVYTTLVTIDEFYNTEFSKSKGLVDDLTYHVYALMLRLSHKFQLKNPNHSRMGLRHLYPNLVSVDFVNLHPHLSIHVLTRDEMSLFALHFAATINDFKNHVNYNVRSILLGSNMVQSNPKFIGSRLRTVFPNARVHLRGMKLVESSDFDDFDVVILTSRINYTERSTNTLVFDMNPIPLESEIKRLEREVMLKQTINLCRKPVRLKDLMTSDLYFVETDATLSYRDVVGKYARIMELKGYAKKGYTDSVLERERVGTTLYAGGVGGTHAINDFSLINSVAVVVLPSHDDSLKIIMLFNIKREDFYVYQEVSDVYPYLVKHPRLFLCSTRDDFIEMMDSFI